MSERFHSWEVQFAACTAEPLETKHIEPSGKVVHGKKAAGFQWWWKEMIICPLRLHWKDTFLLMLFMRPRVAMEKFIRVGRILESNQLSNLSNCSLYTLQTLQYINQYPLEYRLKDRIFPQKQIRVVIFCSFACMRGTLGFAVLRYWAIFHAVFR